MTSCADRQTARAPGAAPASRAGRPFWLRRTSWLGVAPPRRSLPHRDSRFFDLWNTGAHTLPASARVMTKCLERATEVMRADAGFHPDPTRRQIGESGLHLATRPLLPQHDGTALILANDVERVLADIDADYGGRSVEFLRHGVLLVLSAPCQLLVLAGPEHGRTIPLADNRLASTLSEN